MDICTVQFIYYSTLFTKFISKLNNFIDKMHQNRNFIFEFCSLISFVFVHEPHHQTTCFMHMGSSEIQTSTHICTKSLFIVAYRY